MIPEEIGEALQNSLKYINLKSLLIKRGVYKTEDEIEREVDKEFKISATNFVKETLAKEEEK
jgi:hypothetical protein